MNEYYKNAILKMDEIHQRISPEFSCHMCKTEINPPICNGCPIYCSTFSND